jgi:hypothetical protein
LFSVRCFSDYEIFRLVGRIALPIYAWGIVMGFLYTRNLNDYMHRLLWTALAAQLRLFYPLHLAILSLLKYFFH